jgi:hypothetical protein
VRRHETDVLSLVAGLLFIALAAIFVLAESGSLDLEPRFIWPVLLIGLGVAGLAGSRGRARRTQEGRGNHVPTARQSQEAP